MEGKVTEVRCVFGGVEAAKELVLDEGGAAAEAVGLDRLALLGLDKVLQLRGGLDQRRAVHEMGESRVNLEVRESDHEVVLMGHGGRMLDPGLTRDRSGQKHVQKGFSNCLSLHCYLVCVQN